MKRASSLVFGLLLLGFSGMVPASAQDRVAVTFKAFPPEYELFAGGDRLPYNTTGEGLRTYYLPAGPFRVNLAAPGAAPLSLSLEVKPGMAVVQAKLEPRSGPLALVGEAATGKLPRNLAFSADGKKLFVALQGDGGIDVFDVPSLKKSGRLVPADGSQGGFTDVAAVGSEVWGVQNDGRIHAFNGSTLSYKDAKDVTGGGNAFLMDLGGGRIAVANWDNFVLFAVDGTTRTVQASLSLGGNLRGFAADHGTGWATLFDAGKVAVIDTGTWKLKATWSAGKAPRPVAALGTSIFVGDMGNAEVLILDSSSGKILATVPVPSNPVSMAVSPDKSLVAVASRGRNNPVDYQQPGPEYGRITVLDPHGNLVGAVWGRNQPTGLAFSADGRYLAFTDFLDNNLELYRVTAGKTK